MLRRKKRGCECRPIAHHIAFVLAALVFGWVGVGRAQAQDSICQRVNAESTPCDQGKALTDCSSALEPMIKASAYAPNVGNQRCILEADSRTYIAAYDHNFGMPAPWRATAAHNSGRFFYKGLCSARPQISSGFKLPNGSLQCISGCEYAEQDNGDDTSTTVPNGNVCLPPTFDSGKNNQCYVPNGPVQIALRMTLDE